METEQQAGVARLSLRGVLVMLLLVLGAGFLGGYVGGLWFTPNLPPLTNDSDQLVATVQEVTISPSKAAAELVAEQRDSVLLLGHVTDETIEPVAIGAVVTNDGIVVTPTLPRQQPSNLVAFDGEHAGIGLSLLGRDEVYGLTYYRLQDGVLTPFDLAQVDPAVGGELLEISRDRVTTLPMALKVGIEKYELPESSQVKGWQRLVRLNQPSDKAFLLGNVLVTDEGAVAAMRISPEGIAVPVSVIRESVQRLTRQEREYDPFEPWGVTLRYDFLYEASSGQVRFRAAIAEIAPGSAAETAQLRVGDRITRVGDTEVTWETSLAVLFASKEPSLSITRERADRSEEVVLRKIVTPSL